MDVDKQIKNEDEETAPKKKPAVKEKKGAKKEAAQKASDKGTKDDAVVKAEPAAKSKTANTASELQDPEAEGDEEADEEELQAAFSRPPPVHSDYLPLPWKGRLGYVSQLSHYQSMLY